MTVALNWKLALAVIILLVIVTLITDYIVAGTMSTILVVPAATLVLTGNLILMLILCVPTTVMLFKHRDNFVRIRKGTEVGLRCAIKGEHKMK